MFKHIGNHYDHEKFTSHKIGWENFQYRTSRMNHRFESASITVDGVRMDEWDKQRGFHSCGDIHDLPVLHAPDTEVNFLNDFSELLTRAGH
jgi:hypothetical protein